MRLSIIVSFILLLINSCSEIEKNKKTLPPSTGKYGEILVVVDTIFESRQTGEELNEIFFKQMVGLPQQEAQFRMSTVSHKGFKSILKRSRNILKLSIGKGRKTAISIENNVWADDQLLLNITAASDSDAARILQKNRGTIRAYFNEKEVNRLKKQYQKKPQKDLMKDIEKTYKIKVTIPPGFIKMEETKNGFWLKKEKTIGEHQLIQGVSFYSYPYESDSVFAVKELIEKRNKFTRKHIQGVRDSSFMVVYDEYVPNTRTLNLNNHYTVEYRGLWNMENDFMGGPFLHYTFVDQDRNRVINMDGFVFAPKFNKREYLRELEALMKTVKLSPVN